MEPGQSVTSVFDTKEMANVDAIQPTKHRNTLDKIHFHILKNAYDSISTCLRTFYYRQRGAYIGARTRIPRATVTWPHQLWIGDDCDLENEIRFHHSGCLKPGPNIVIGNRNFFGYRCEFIIMSRIEIGNDCQFAAGCKFIDINHEIDRTTRINAQRCYGKPIKIHNDVWFGANVLVLPGVTVGEGAVVAAGAIVTKDIPSYEIWAGVPARKIGERQYSDQNATAALPQENVAISKDSMNAGS